MKKKMCIAAIVYSVLLGAARAADLFLNTDPATGFLTRGPAAARYLAMAPAVALCLLAGLYVPKKQPCRLDAEHARPGWTLWLWPPLAAAFLACGALSFLAIWRGERGYMSVHHANDSALRAGLFTAVQSVRAALFLVLGAWCVLRFFEYRRGASFGGWTLHLGTLGSAAFYLHTVLRFISQPSSLHRLAPACAILSSLAALLFLAKLLRAGYLVDGGSCAPALCGTGLFAFCFCTCLLLPQAVWQVSAGEPRADVLALSLAEVLLGVMGAADALRIAKRPPRAKRENAQPARGG